MGRTWPVGDPARWTEQAGEIRAVTAYLWDRSLGHPIERRTVDRSEGAVRRGHELVLRSGCTACHSLDASDGELLGDRRTGSTLARIGEKLVPEWTALWLENPRALMPQARMPNLRLSRQEASDIAAYLATLVRQQVRPPPEYLVRANDRRRLVDQGRRLIVHYGCPGCHSIPGIVAPGRIGVELTGVGSKLTEELDPGSLASEDALGEPLGGALWRPWIAARGAASGKAVPDPGAAPAVWEAWLARVDPMAHELVRTVLPRPGSRTRGRMTRASWIATKLLDPRAFERSGRAPPGRGSRPQGPGASQLRMPDPGLSPREILALVTYLLGSTAEGDRISPSYRYRPSGPRESIFDGERVIELRGCRSCHRFERGLDPDLASTLRQPLAWREEKLDPLRPPVLPGTVDPGRTLRKALFLVPDLAGDGLSATERKALVSLAFEQAVNEPDAYFLLVRLHRELAAELSEPVDLTGHAPPALDFEGARVKSQWLFEFLQKPEPLRPWLKIRMPTFDLSDEETRRLVRYFAARSSVQPFQTDRRPSLTPEERVRVARLVEKDCVKCHVPNPPPDKIAEAAPELKHCWRRIRPAWTASFSLAPELYIPATKMPQLFLMKQNAYPDLAGGDAVRQIHLVADYLSTYGMPVSTATTTGPQ
jgi:mono/diheme cytochrome c family protein